MNFLLSRFHLKKDFIYVCLKNCFEKGEFPVFDLYVFCFLELKEFGIGEKHFLSFLSFMKFLFSVFLM